MRVFPVDEPFRPAPKRNNIWYKDRNTGQVIVFVHGVLSDSQGCWYRESSSQSAGVYWPDLLQNDKRFSQYSIYLGGYETDVDSGPYEISDCAEELFKALERPDENTARAVLDEKTIIFVCHSMGGIVVRYLLTARPWHFQDAHCVALFRFPLGDPSRFVDRLFPQRSGKGVAVGQLGS